jgi:hypothetical protein
MILCPPQLRIHPCLEYHHILCILGDNDLLRPVEIIETGLGPGSYVGRCRVKWLVWGHMWTLVQLFKRHMAMNHMNDLSRYQSELTRANFDDSDSTEVGGPVEDQREFEDDDDKGKGKEKATETRKELDVTNWQFEATTPSKQPEARWNPHMFLTVHFDKPFSDLYDVFSRRKFLVKLPKESEKGRLELESVNVDWKKIRGFLLEFLRTREAGANLKRTPKTTGEGGQEQGVNVQAEMKRKRRKN